MNVTMISDSFFEDLLYQENFIKNEYLSRGYNLTIITSTFENISDYYNDKYDTNSRLKIIEQFSYKLIRIPYSINIFNRVRKFSNIMPYLKESNPDLIFIHDIQFNIHEVVSYVKQSKRPVRLILDFHADYSNSAKNLISRLFLHKFLKGIYFKFYQRYFNAILPIVPDSLLFLKNLYGVPEKKMKLFPLGVDYQKSIFYLNGPYRNDIRSRIGAKENSLVIFTGGKLEPRKQTEQIITVLQELKDLDIKLIIGGDFVSCDDIYKENLLSLIKNDTRIFYTGWLTSDEVYEYMSASDIAIYPSSQSVLWQQSIGMSLPTVVGKYVNLDDGRCLDQKVEYLNFDKNVIVLNDKHNKTSEIKSAILFFMDANNLSAYKFRAAHVAKEVLNYEKLVDLTLQIDLR